MLILKQSSTSIRIYRPDIPMQPAAHPVKEYVIRTPSWLTTITPIGRGKVADIESVCLVCALSFRDT
jgi:hypothetical protein